MKEAKVISQWVRPLLLLFVPLIALFVYVIATKEWAALLGLVAVPGALFVTPPKLPTSVGGESGFGRAREIVGVLVAGVVLGLVFTLTGCCTHGGALDPGVKPWLEPVVELCVPVCDVAHVEALQAADLVEDDTLRILARMGAGMAHQVCVFGCLVAEQEVQPDP